MLDQAPTGGNLSGVSGERSVGATNGVPFGFLSHAAFVNDDFRIRPNLTLNLGVRYEYVTMPVGSRAQQYSAIANVPGRHHLRQAEFFAQRLVAAPRLCLFARKERCLVHPRRRQPVLRPHLHQPQPECLAAVLSDHARRDPTPAGHQFPGEWRLDGDPALGNAIGSRRPRGGRLLHLQQSAALRLNRDPRRPAASSRRDYTIEARYVYTKGVHLWNQTRMNILSRVTPTDFLPTFFSMPDAVSAWPASRRPLASIKANTSNYLAQYGFTNNIVGYHPWGNSRYNGLQLQVNKRYSKNFSYIVAYTWSHNFDDSTATNFSTILSPRRAQDFQNMRAEWASSALDRRHRFTFTPIYDFKPFQNGNWLMKNIVGNWNISGTYTFQSPEYATVQSGVDSNLNGDTAGDRAIINPAGRRQRRQRRHRVQRGRAGQHRRPTSSPTSPTTPTPATSWPARAPSPTADATLSRSITPTTSTSR